jgi:glutamate formiminotransferase / formiminotetrahydrofolate cyclodeaminase
MQKIVECVPNFSEGRRPEVIDAIVQAITSVKDVYLLDREMDADHNRAVITIVGPPETIGEAAVRGVEEAAKHIDLTKHQGAHPRMGATDVVPFIPIRGVTLDDCVMIARTVGKQIAEKFQIPVYLYEAAATKPERTNLENIRRGQFEGIRDEIATNPARMPDFGEARVHPTAGATVVGARKPLIAYNVNLNTPDVDVAKKIAKRIRFSTGGFRFVKGMGLLLKERNIAQVSMNLTDYEQTSVELVFETVKREAERFGVSVAGSEIVGLIPQKALEQAAEYFLRVENFKPQMILENRLSEVMSGVSTSAGGMNDGLRDFVDRVASAEPVPGGGSVSALSGALGAALGQMAIRLTKNKKSFVQHAERYLDALDRLAPYRSALLELIDADAEAFNRVMAAYKISKESPERDTAIQKALIRATEIPSRTANCSAEAMKVLEDLRSIVHPNVASDMQVALTMLRSAIRGAVANMRINLGDVKDSDERLRYEDMIAGFEQALRGGN